MKGFVLLDVLLVWCAFVLLSWSLMTVSRHSLTSLTVANAISRANVIAANCTELAGLTPSMQHQAWLFRWPGGLQGWAGQCHCVLRCCHVNLHWHFMGQHQQHWQLGC